LKTEGKVTVRTTVTAVELVAHRQYGVFSRDQALASAVTRTMLNFHSRPGRRWRRVAPQVYEVVAQPADWRRPLMAAQLWGGSRAVLCGSSAATILDLDGVDRRVVEIYSTSRSSRPPWIVHRGSPPAEHVSETKRLRHTDALLTLRDLSRGLDLDHLERAVESVLRLRLLSEAELRREPSLRRVLARRPVAAPPTGSELETRMIQLLRDEVDIPEPVRQHPVELTGERTVYLDLAFPEAGLFIELDGRKSHDRAAALLYDRHRQNGIVALGSWHPLRYTWDDVCDHPLQTARHVAEAYRAHVGLGSRSRIIGEDPAHARR
jgi:hypothetical protein